MKSVLDSKTNNFDFIRLVLAILVIFSHSYKMATGSLSGEWFVRMTHGQTDGGSLAVDAFFIISGYLITASYEHSRSLGAYLIKRVRRIYPAFIAVTVVDLLVILPISAGRLAGNTPVSRGLRLIWKTISLSDIATVGAFQLNHYAGLVNGSLWTIRYEFLCYLCLALLGVCGFLANKRRTLVLFAIIMAAVMIVTQTRLNPYDRAIAQSAYFCNIDFLLRMVPMYLAGVVAYLYRDRIKINLLGAIIACGAVLVAVLLPAGLLAVLPVAGAYLILLVAYGPWIHLHSFARYGDFSYGTYLYAFPIQQTILCLTRTTMNPLLLFATATPVTVLIAMLSWHLLEKRFLSRSRVMH